MIASPLRPRHRQESGIAAAGQLAHRGTPYGASLSFATATHLWPLPDPPSRKSRSATSRTGTARSIPGRALASSVLDSPCQGSRTGLTPPISTSVPSTPATRRPSAGPDGLPLDTSSAPAARHLWVAGGQPLGGARPNCNHHGKRGLRHASRTSPHRVSCLRQACDRARHYWNVRQARAQEGSLPC